MYRFFFLSKNCCKYAGKGAMNATYVPDLKCIGADKFNVHACMRITIIYSVTYYDYTYIHVSIVIKLRQNDFKNPFELLVFVIKSKEETSRGCFRMNSSTTVRLSICT